MNPDQIRALHSLNKEGAGDIPVVPDNSIDQQGKGILSLNNVGMLL